MLSTASDTPKSICYFDDEDDDAESRPPRPKFRRSRNGCMICKRMKVKCDERKPRCTGCWRKGKKCIYPTASEKSPISEHGGNKPSPVQSGKPDKVASPEGYQDQDGKKGVFSNSSIDVLPQTDINLSRSLLLNRRARNKPAKVNRLNTLTATQSMIAVMENIVAALEPTTPLFEFGPQEWGSFEVNGMPDDGRWNYSAQNLPLDFVPDSGNDRLSQVFPSQLARQLFNFYVTTTSRILITMGTRGPNPFLSLTSSVGFFDMAAAENCALRMGMLATSANHYVYVIRSTEKFEDGQEPPILNILENIGKRFKIAALSNLTIAVSNAEYDAQSVNVDITLAACLTLINRDIMSADTSCHENLDFAIALVNKRGGPQKLLQQTRSNFCRFVMESVAIHELFGTFTTGKQPVLFNSWTPWWFESLETSRTSWEWESVERQFGFSRPTADLIARISTLFSRKRMIGLSLKSDTWRRKEMSGITDHLVSEATVLLTELDIWGNSLNCLPQHPRVNCGDQIYRYTMKIHLLADILETPKEDPRITTSIASVLELLSEASCMGLVVMLVWPLLIAGAFCHVSQRDYIRALFQAYKPHYCSDLESARIILNKQWENMDNGLGFRPWGEVMQGLKLELVLI